MNFEFSLREKVLLIIAAFAFVFMLYWYVLLAPLFATIDNNQQEIHRLATENKNAQMVSAALSKLGPQKMVKYYQREEQISHIIAFVNERFKAHGIKMASMGQSNSGDQLIIDVQFQSSYPALQKFLSDIVNLDMLLVIDTINVNQAGSQLAVGLTLRSGYLK